MSQSESENDSQVELEEGLSNFREGTSEEDDWYNSSDTSDEIPNPNENEDPLYQDINTLPVPLRPEHFQEGLIYAMTVKEKLNHNTLLVMIIHAKRRSFVYRLFFARGSARKTYHQGLIDTEIKFSDV